MPGQQAKSFLPDFCGVRTVLAVVLSATLLAMVLSLVATSILRDFWEVFSILALYILWVGLAAAALICLLKRWLGRLGHGLAGLLAWCLIMLVALAVSLSANWLVPLDEMADVSPKELLIRTLGISGILGALILR
ncbi:MAG TPA: hypothetical protein ENG92_03090 [Thiolapillus brandeum]|uniref:Uncharacterized protein n=1 Tax=Thiolapillus brandeum TaxID=1076588 RepID=A0A831K2L3_9GAMM|nr:hypothetical protein [Thiolapillus brandeum]